MLDFDALAKAMMPGSDAEHVTVEWVRRMASGAWYGAYRHMVRVTEPVELWLVKTLPSRREALGCWTSGSPWTMTSRSATPASRR